MLISITSETMTCRILLCLPELIWTMSLKKFFIHLGVHDKLDPLDVFDRSIFKWLRSKKGIKFYLNRENYAPIMKYVAKQYFEIERKLNYFEKAELRKLPVLTSNNEFEAAENCYFDTEIPAIQALGCIIAVNKLVVSTKGISEEIENFLIAIGVSTKLTPVDIIRKRILESNIQVHEGNHIEIINYLARNYEDLTNRDFDKLKMKEFILTESNQFAEPKLCYLPDAVPITELKDVLASDEKISSVYDIESLKEFFNRLGVHDKLDHLDVFNRSIFKWLRSENGIGFYLNRENYAPIMEYVAKHYFKIEKKLDGSEKDELKKLPVLTSSNEFETPENCYFDTAIPAVQGLEGIIAASKLISTKEISKEMKNFLIAIGVKDSLSPTDVIRKSVLQWIEQNEIQKRMTNENHSDVLEYIGTHWSSTLESDLTPEEINTMNRILVMTKGNKLSEACQCYWSLEDNIVVEDIPEIESIIPLDTFVSPDYSRNVKNLIRNLNIRTLKFTTIYEQYSDHLSKPENIEWFFSNLVKHWEKTEKEKDTDQLLNYLQKKFQSSSLLLGKDKKMYCSTELYSSQLETVFKIDSDYVPLFFYKSYKTLPKGLESWLGFQMELDLPCIQRLFDTMNKKNFSWDTLKPETFFPVLLKQLRLKDKSDIENYKLSLLAKSNKLTPAKSLYYFKEEDADCIVDSCYLKRIHSMSHKDTLKLAELCGVNILPFKHHVTFEEQKCDKTLEEFYLKRLTFIVMKEANKINEQHSITLKRLYDKISSVELYQCRVINVKYPFGNSDIQKHFDELKLYVTRKWTKWKTDIHYYLKRKLDITACINDIIDMESIMQEDIDDWLDDNKEDLNKFNSIQKELELLQTEKETELSVPTPENKKDTDLLVAAPENEKLDSENLSDVSVSNESNSVTSPLICRDIKKSKKGRSIDKTRSVAEHVNNTNVEWSALGRSDDGKKKASLEHIHSIYKEYSKPSSLLRSFTNLSNTVIETALSGQSKFVFEILQNADDAFEDVNKPIYVELIVQDEFLIIHHNGKGFDYKDVQRICDFASQITEVKANDWSKTGYKGLGFKSLFNLSDCIYIHSNNYSFCFDKTHWNNPEEKPWQIIPIWCEYEDLPLHEKFPHDQPVNIILKLKNVEELRNQLIEVIKRPELLLFLHRVDKLNVISRKGKFLIERIKSEFEPFTKVEFFINQGLQSTWLLRMFNPCVPIEVLKSIQDCSQYIYPDKIKSAKNAPITFAVRVDKDLENVIKVNGLCYGTLPTQLDLKLPYHVNSLFILNLDRTQLHQNEWNEFLINRLGYLQLKLFQDLAVIPHLKNYVIQLFEREIEHPYQAFCKAFVIGFKEAQTEIQWLPAQQGHLLKLGEAWTDPIEFFRQNFPNICDHTISPFIISYDVRRQTFLSKSEVKTFDFLTLLSNFPQRYYPQLTENGYINFIDYLLKNLSSQSHEERDVLKSTSFLRAKDGSLICPEGAWLEDNENPLPEFLKLNPVDYRFLPPKNAASIKSWLIDLGAKNLKTPVDIIRESLLENAIKLNEGNHIEIINYLAKNYQDLTNRDLHKLKEKKFVLTESNQFAEPDLCYLPNAVPIKELKDAIASEEMISSVYDMESLKDFFIYIGVHDTLHPLDVIQRTVLLWINQNEIQQRMTIDNHANVLEYIGKHWFSIHLNLTKDELDTLNRILVMTKGNKLREANQCYWSHNLRIKAIPEIESIISLDAFVSPKYSEDLKKFLRCLKIHTLKFTTIYEQYSDHLSKPKNIEWFFSNLVNYWQHMKKDDDELLNYLQKKLKSSSLLLGKDEEMHCSTDLYSSQLFEMINSIDPNFIPFLHYEKLPEDLELWLGFQMELDLPCIVRLFDAMYKKPLCGKNKTGTFFMVLLEQLKKKDKSAIENYTLSLLTKGNELKPAKTLYYFKEKDADCIIDSCYLKRIHTMSHEDTLLLAELCGVNILPFEHDVTTEERKYDNTLKAFYMQRLPFIVIKEAKELNEQHSILLKQLYEKICSVVLYQCGVINVHYKFGSLTTQKYFDELTLYVTHKWTNMKSKIHGHLKGKLCITTCIDDIIDMESVTKKHIDYWLLDNKEDAKKLISIQAELQLLRGNNNKEFLVPVPKSENLNFAGPDDIIVNDESNADTSPIKEMEESRDGTNRGKTRFVASSSNEDVIDVNAVLPAIGRSDYDDGENVYFRNNYQSQSLKDTTIQDLAMPASFPLAETISRAIQKTAGMHVESSGAVPKSSAKHQMRHLGESYTFTFQQGHYRNKYRGSKFNAPGVFTRWYEPSLKIEINLVKENHENTFPLYIWLKKDGDIKRLIEVKPSSVARGDSFNVGHLKFMKRIVETRTVDQRLMTADAEWSAHSQSGSNDGANENLIHNYVSEFIQQYLFPVPHEEQLNFAGSRDQAVRDESNLVAPLFREIEESENGGGIDETRYLDEQAIDVNAQWPAVCKPNYQRHYSRKNKRYHSAIPGNFSFTRTVSWAMTETTIMSVEPSRIVPETREKHQIQRLGEIYVFAFQQDQYKNKYPNSVFDVSRGVFTLWYEPSHQIEITWINEREDKKLPYDILIKEDGDIKRFIEVKSTSAADGDSFDVSHLKFIERMNRLPEFQPILEQKYWLYRVFNVENSLTTTDSENSTATALYKIELLKN